MNAVLLTQDTSPPIGNILSFSNAASVSKWFGPAAAETALAATYFAGRVGQTKIPPVIYFVQWPNQAVGAYLRGGTGLMLSQIQALSGTISIAVDGANIVSASINLSTATSMTNAAALIQAGLQAGTPSNNATCQWDALRGAFVIGSSTTGSTSSVAYPTDTSLSPALLITQAAGAVISQGSDALSPSAMMTSVTNLTQDWATFMTVTDPDAGAAGGPIKVQFSQWVAAQSDDYMYVAYDSDPAVIQSPTYAACFAQTVAGLDGTFAIWDATQGAQIAAFACGITASIDFTTPNGRTSFAYRSSPALTPTITDVNAWSNLDANGYNAYVNVATRTTQFQWLQRGKVSGSWVWADSYINQIYWNAQFQNDLALYESQVSNIPYTADGYGALRQACMSDIIAMGAFGAWSAGVTLSDAQAAEVNADAGLTIAPTLQQVGYYFLAADPGPTVRAARGSPILKFYYTDAGSVNQINLSSTDVQ